MQGAPTQQPQQPQQAPAMPNDPRMGAAMGLVDDSVEKFNLDPQTEALMLKNQALDLLKAADNVGKMNVPQQDTNIQEQTEQGIAGMLQSLSPGMQQRGQQMQRSQARQMLGGGAPARPRPPMPQQNMARPPARPPMGGMPTMGAPNMARMADGGIVGYAGPDGSKVEAMAPQMPMAGQTQDPSSDASDPEVNIFLRELEKLNKQLEAAFPQEKDLFQQKIMDLINTTSPRVKRIASDSPFGSPKKDGMARGGIIGYKKGGKPELDAEILAGLPSRVEVSPPSYPSIEDRRAERERKNEVRAANTANRDAEFNLRVQLAAEGYDRAAQDQYIEAQKAKRLGAVGDFSGLGSLRAPEPFRMQGTNNPPEFRMLGTNNPSALTGTQYRPELDGPLPVGGMGGEAVGTTETPVVTPATAPAARQEFTPDALDLLTEEKLKAALNADPDTAATTRGERLRELTGFDDLMARRIESEKAVRAQKESRLTPEETRKRRVREGLARLAEQGLGGFGAGRTAEMDKIAAERLGIAETSLADLNSLIAEKRAMGMTQFEAENSARAEIQGSQDNAATAAGRRRDARLAAFEATQENALNRAATAEQNRLNRENNLVIAELNTSTPTDFMNAIKIRVDALQANTPGLSDVDARSQALEARIEDQARAQLAAAGIRADTLELDRLKAAYSMAGTKLANRFDLITDSDAFNTAFRKEVKDIMAEFGTGTYPPMPTERSQLVQGTIYSTRQGNARWNGTNFIPVN